MASKEQLALIKKATVAVALLPDQPPTDPKVTPFTIVASGFCIDPTGIILTCEHVISYILKHDVRQEIADLPLENRIPYVLFYSTEYSEEELFVLPISITMGIRKLEYDLGLIKLSQHRAFHSGYPYIEIEEFENIYEGMEVATCGFPMGNELHEQLGTKTSSFTKGILSSIAPANTARKDLVTGFQLDLTATFGNSGGPVFSWETGKVFGVLQSGPKQRSGTSLSGITRAESVYRLLLDGTVERLRDATPPKKL